MDDRERMIQLIQDIVVPYFADQIADHLIANGVGFVKKTPIETLDLCLRGYNALKRAGIDTVEELRAWDEERLANIRGIGVTVLAEILEKRSGGAGCATEETSVSA